MDWEAHPGHPADVSWTSPSHADIDLIVVGNKGMTGARRYLLGGVADKLSHHAPVQRDDRRTD